MAAPSALTYGTLPMTCMMGVPTIPNHPTSAGSPVVSYSVSPALPAGLVLSTTTGKITGKPTAITPAATYIVTATNIDGSTTVGVVIEVIAKQNDLLVTFPVCEEFQADPFVSSTNKNIVGNPPSAILPDGFLDTPMTMTVTVGSAIAIEATGITGSISSYQWYKDGVIIGGATAKTYAYTGVIGGGVFTCLVTNSFGAILTNPITVIVKAILPAFTLQPASIGITTGTSTTLTVTATGNPTPTYLWEQTTTPFTTWITAFGGTGGTTAAYTTPALTAERRFRCVLTNVGGSVTSNVAAVTIV